MKKILLTALFACAASFLTRAQLYVDGKNINEWAITYIKMMGVGESVNGYSYLIDVGLEVDYKVDITDVNGKPVIFLSEMDVLNHILRNGWELVGFYETSTSSILQKDFYLLKKKDS